jgi:membrane protease YdiL (CAAX protease family)
MEGDMNDKASLENPKTKNRFKWFKGLQYWIAVISYLIVFSLSILCLASYLPHLYDADALHTGTLKILYAMLIIMLIIGTAAFVWETLQWRKKKRARKDQPTVENIISRGNKDSNNSR